MRRALARMEDSDRPSADLKEREDVACFVSRWVLHMLVHKAFAV
jgi:hypothetical protein